MGDTTVNLKVSEAHPLSGFVAVTVMTVTPARRVVITNSCVSWSISTVAKFGLEDVAVYVRPSPRKWRARSTIVGCPSLRIDRLGMSTFVGALDSGLISNVNLCEPPAWPMTMPLESVTSMGV